MSEGDEIPLFKQVVDKLTAEYGPFDITDIKLDTKLEELNSLSEDLEELAGFFEEEFELDVDMLPNSEFEGWTTVADVVRSIEEHLA